MKHRGLAIPALLLLAPLPSEALGQSPMPGMHMPMPMPAKPAPKKKAPARKPAPAKPRAAAPHRAHVAIDAAPAAPAPVAPTPPAQPMGHVDMGGMPMSNAPNEQSMPMPQGEHGGHVAMTGTLGRYPMERESSGTAWQPDRSEHMGVMQMSGSWTLMAHGTLNLVYDHQAGRRGDDKAFASGMLMGMARRPLGNGTLQLRASISPDPLMGPRGYPLLLASGETANGRDRLIDRQHPHDLFMELSASVSQSIGAKSSIFLYGALPGEPAFGPPAFMHREAIMDSPEAPISHHWLDSTHISFGVLTAGLVFDRVKLEVSRFNAREPDQHRWNIETGPLDSTAIRLSWNPTRQLSLQGSWGHFVDPEQLEPGVDQKRWSASLLYADELSPGWKVAGTLAWGRKSAEGHSDDALVAEASLKHAGWTVFGRGEVTDNRELVPADEPGPAFRVGKISVGAVRDFRIAPRVSLGPGALVALNFVPGGLAPAYGGHHPIGAMGFVRLKLD